MSRLYYSCSFVLVERCTKSAETRRLSRANVGAKDDAEVAIGQTVN